MLTLEDPDLLSSISEVSSKALCSIALGLRRQSTTRAQLAEMDAPCSWEITVSVVGQGVGSSSLLLLDTEPGLKATPTTPLLPPKCWLYYSCLLRFIKVDFYNT